MGRGRREGVERGWGGDVRERGGGERGRVGREGGRVGREGGEGSGAERRDDCYTYSNRYVQ